MSLREPACGAAAAERSGSSSGAPRTARVGHERRQLPARRGAALVVALKGDAAAAGRSRLSKVLRRHTDIVGLQAGREMREAVAGADGGVLVLLVGIGWATLNPGPACIAD